MIIRVTYLNYTEQDNEVVVRVVGRSEDGESVPLHVHGCEPYGYYPEEEPTPEMDCIVSEEYGYESYDGKPLKKITVQLPEDMNQSSEIRNHFSQTFESDIPYYRRMAIDGLSGYIEVPDNKRSVNIDDLNTEPEYDGEITPRVMIGDIEVLPDMDKTVEESVEQAEEPVVAITLYDTQEEDYTAIILDEDHQINGKEIRSHMEDHWGDSQDNDYQEYAEADVTLKRCNSEEAVLKEFIRHFEERKPDLSSGWNWITYDWKYLLNRMRKFDSVNQHDLSDVGTASPPGWNTERAVDGVPAFDMMSGFCETLSRHDWRSTALDYVANEQFGMGKMEDADVHTDYKRHRNRLLAYNIVDVQLTVKLDRDNDIHDYFFTLADISSVMIYDVAQ